MILQAAMPSCLLLVVWWCVDRILCACGIQEQLCYEWPADMNSGVLSTHQADFLHKSCFN